MACTPCAAIFEYIEVFYNRQLGIEEERLNYRTEIRATAHHPGQQLGQR
jgi:hypothetical protein